MDDPFLRSRQTLAGEGARGWLLGALGVVVLLAAWTAWLVLARVPVYAVSAEARLESVAMPRRVQAEVAGAVQARRASLGDSVAAGDVLFEIDASRAATSLTEQHAKRDSIAEQIKDLEEQTSRTTQALADERVAGVASVAEQQARVDESRAAAEFAGQEARRGEDLYRNGLISSSDKGARDADAAQKRAAAEREAQTLLRLKAELAAEEQSRQGRLAELERELEQLRGGLQQVEKASEGLARDVERHTVVAPLDGTVAEIADLEPGSFVQAGDHLATILPEGGIGVVAQFQPSEAFGRVRPGQPCRVRLEGFSWMRYGVLEARVERVATEARSGRVRVEARLEGEASAAIPREHGLPGVLEVEIERVSPIALALRAAGRRFGPAPRASGEATSNPAGG